MLVLLLSIPLCPSRCSELPRRSSVSLTTANSNPAPSNGSLLAGDLVEAAKQASYVADGSRLVGANMGWISPIKPGTPMVRLCTCVFGETPA